MVNFHLRPLLLLLLPSVFSLSAQAFSVPTKRGTTSGSIVVNATTGVKLAYLDSGAPPNVATYTTIVAVHGMIFNNLVFQNFLAAAPAKGVRVVAFNRRPYPGSTPFTTTESNFINNGGSQADLDSQMEERGHEIANFIDKFITTKSLPAISADGKSGGVVILGWSVGAWGPLAAVGTSATLPADVQTRLGNYIRSTILYEPAPLVMGLPNSPDQWTPLQDTSFDASLTVPAFGQHVTAFFDHGDLSKRDSKLLSWVLPSTAHIPTIYTIPTATQAQAISYGADTATELPFLTNFQTQLHSVYRKAWFDTTIAAKFPHMKRAFLVGKTSPAFGITGAWAIQDDAAATPPPAPITYKFVDNINHFYHWVDPKGAIDAVLSLA